MEEHVILHENELPYGHPKNFGYNPSYAEQKWDLSVSSLMSGQSNSFNHVLYILQHNDWYTDDDRREIRRLASKYPFAAKQRERISNPPQLKREEEDDYWDESYYGDY